VSQHTESHSDECFLTIPSSAFRVTVDVVIPPVALEIIVGPIVIVIDWLLNIKPFNEYIKIKHKLISKLID
jgi:hypothetical protein